MNPSPPWIPEVFVLPTRDGSNTIYSHQYGATYHSLHGAVSESRHVFIQEGLNLLRSESNVNVLEFGFGSGLNALLAYQFSLRHGIQVSYTGIETNFLNQHLIDQLDYAAYLGISTNDDILNLIHTNRNAQVGNFEFQILESLQDIPESKSFNCIFFDAFAPNCQPECWHPEVFTKLNAILEPGGFFVTYCAQGEVRRNLQAAGFTVNRIAGPSGKREMIRASKLSFIE